MQVVDAAFKDGIRIANFSRFVFAFLCVPCAL